MRRRAGIGRQRRGEVRVLGMGVSCALLLLACGQEGADPGSGSPRSDASDARAVPHDHDGDGRPDHGPEAHADPVPHDHDGDGRPDHGPEAHADPVPHDHDGDGRPDHGPEAHADPVHVPGSYDFEPDPAIPGPAALAQLPADGGPSWNRLVFEKSPYLLQHAANPVDWYPWGEEAFARAKAEGKPVFVSIGYSTCHWCHVMEHESFEDEALAAYLNEHFVCVKVDREERPDVDNLYMTAVQAMTGQGGWPLNVFLLPDGRPFFGGTYYPLEDSGGRPGFRAVLARVIEVWSGQREQVEQGSDLILRQVRMQIGTHTGGSLGDSTLVQARNALVASFDRQNGGFGSAPKFPRTHTLTFLLRQHARSGDPLDLEVVRTTLDKMARGGIRDHVGGGFHRYAVDARWLVPHFEKMLYDQALIAEAYLEAFQVTGDESFARVAREVFEYVDRELTDSGGGFHSAEDADSEGEEGRFYVWTPEEIAEALGPEEGVLFAEVYGVTDEGNYGGRSILSIARPPAAVARERGLTTEELESRLDASREKLRQVRDRRVHPHLDDKILTAWNGLMISALAKGSRVLDEPLYAEQAARAADFVLRELRAEDGSLYRRYRSGEAAVPGFLEDYAFLANALVDLYEATFEVRWLREALDLRERMDALFWDVDSSGYFVQGPAERVRKTGSGEGAEGIELVARAKPVYDGAIPSGNSVAALLLHRLSDLTGDPVLARRAGKLKDSFSGVLARAPQAHTQMMIALDYQLGPTIQIVLAGEPGSESTRTMLRPIRERFLPRAVIAVRPGGTDGAALARLAPFLEAHAPRDGGTTAYVCRDHTCSLPTDDVARMLGLIDEEMGRR